MSQGNSVTVDVSSGSKCNSGLNVSGRNVKAPHYVGRLARKCEGRHIFRIVFSQAHAEERKELETGLATVGANSSLMVGGARGWQMCGLCKLF